MSLYCSCSVTFLFSLTCTHTLWFWYIKTGSPLLPPLLNPTLSWNKAFPPDSHQLFEKLHTTSRASPQKLSPALWPGRRGKYQCYYSATLKKVLLEIGWEIEFLWPDMKWEKGWWLILHYGVWISGSMLSHAEQQSLINSEGNEDCSYRINFTQEFHFLWRDCWNCEVNLFLHSFVLQ